MKSPKSVALGLTVLAFGLGAMAPADAGPITKAIAKLVSAVGKVADVLGAKDVGAACAVGEAATLLIEAIAEKSKEASVAVRSDVHVVAAANVGPSYSFPSVAFSSSTFQTEAHALADLYAEHVADANALTPTLQRYYGALSAGDSVPAAFETTFEAGLRDDFAAPIESAAPGVELSPLLNCTVGAKSFDDLAQDRCFGHTFAGLPAGIVGATLEVRLQAQSGSRNDSIQLQAQNDSSAMAWARRIGSDGPVVGILPTLWWLGSEETMVLDLAALPNADGTTQDLLPSLNADGRLDIRVADDTAVDYVSLHLVYADPSLAGLTASEVQAKTARRLVGQMSDRADRIADRFESLAQLGEFQAVAADYADVLSFQADLEANGLPAAELSVLEEMGATAQQIAEVTAAEIEAVIDPFAHSRTGAEVLLEMAASIRSGESLDVVASLPDDFPVFTEPVTCLGASFQAFGDVELTCGVIGIEILTGSGQIVIRDRDSDQDSGPIFKLTAQLGGLDVAAMPPGARLRAETTYETGADSYPVSGEFKKVSEAEFELDTDFAAFAPAKRVEAYLDGSFVAATVVSASVKDGGCTDVPPILGPKSSTGWFNPFPSHCPEWCWGWPTPVPVTLDGIGTVMADQLNVIPEGFQPTPQLYVNELAIGTHLIPSFSVEAVTFGPEAPRCQESLGYASDATARIIVCGGDLSTGTSSNLRLYGAPPLGSSLLVVGLASDPTPFSALAGASLVPFPPLFTLPLPIDESGGHELVISGGGGPFTAYLQEVILGAGFHTVTNAVRVEFLP